MERSVAMVQFRDENFKSNMLPEQNPAQVCEDDRSTELRVK